MHSLCDQAIVVLVKMKLLACYSVFFLLSVILRSSNAQQGMLRNGNFEMAPNASAMKGTVVTGRASLPEWRIHGYVEYITSGHQQKDMLVIVPQGAHAVRLGNEASIAQRIHVKPGSYYSIVFSAARTCAQEEKLNVSVAPFSGMIPIQTLYSSNGWDIYSWAFKAPSSSIRFVLHNPGHEEDPACGPVIDSIAIKQLFPPRFTKFNLIKNGDFEEGPMIFSGSSSGVLLPPLTEDAVSSLPGWIVESLKSVKYIDSEHYYVPKGKRGIELVAGRESALSQEVRTEIGKTYRLSFTVGDARDGCDGPMTVEAFAAKNTVKASYVSKGKGGWAPASLIFKALAHRTRVSFFSSFYHMKPDGSLCGPVIDDVRLTSSKL